MHYECIIKILCIYGRKYVQVTQKCFCLLFNHVFEVLIIFNQSKAYLVPKRECWSHSRITKLTLGNAPIVFLICNELSMTFRPAGAWRDLFQLLSCTVSQHASLWGCVHHDRIWFASIISAWTFSSDCRNAGFAAPEINEPIRESLPGVKPGSGTTYQPWSSNASTRPQARPLACPFSAPQWGNTHGEA